MRFRFCYGQDCPDWVLEQVTAVSKQSAIRLKALVGETADYLIHTKGYDYISPPSKVLPGKKDRCDSIKTGSRSAMAASLAWILTSASRSNVPDAELANELGQLGLPKEHATAIVSVYRVKRLAIYATLSKLWLRLYPLVTDVSWRIEYCLLSSSNPSAMDSSKLLITLSILLSKQGIDSSGQPPEGSLLPYNSSPNIVFTITHDHLAMLIDELKQALQLSKSLVQVSGE